jgi:hypothetical protein
MEKIVNHPISEHFPMMGKEELGELADDIKTLGLRCPIVLYEGKILDGRNRYVACQMAGVEPTLVNYDGTDPLGYVFSLNLLRRNLSVSQRGMLVAKLASMRSGERTDITHQPIRNSGEVDILPMVSLKTAAALGNVSVDTVCCAKTILKKSPKKAAEVANGEKSIHMAFKEIKEKEKPFNTATFDKGRSNALRLGINAINELKKIPSNEPSRQEALRSVVNWINHNK